MKTEVLIVGAGPTGLSLAVQLARYQIDFQIVDKKETTTPQSRAIGVQARTLEIYQQIGIADELIAMGWITEKARLIEGGKIRGEVPLRDIGEGLSPFPFLLIVEQAKHELLLYDHLRTRGADVSWNTELLRFEQNPDSVSAVAKTGYGDERTIEAKYIVGCDGPHSFVRHRLGIPFEGSTFERLFYVADVQIESSFDHNALHVCLAKNTITAFFPMTGNDKRWRIVGTFPEGHDKNENEILYEEIERQIVADTEIKLDITEVNWFSVYKVHSRAAKKFSEGKCFLAGDAAHIHSPAGAQGMNTGIQDGYNLAWKLAMVLRKNAGERLLQSYSQERAANAQRLLRTTDRIFDLGASDDWFISFFRTKIFPYVAGFAFDLNVVRNAVFPLVSQIGINYRDSSISRTGGQFKVKAGDRMPYFEIEGAGIYERLRDAKFHVLIFEDGSAPRSGTHEGADEFADVHSFPLYPTVAEIFGTKRSFVVALRPDNYIGYIGEGNSLEDVRNYLGEILA